jgi:hypothetical protein
MSPATLIVLTVRLYAGTAITDHDLSVARREARDILDRSGVTVAWVDCRSPRTTAVCSAPLTGHELALRFVTAGDASASRVPLGESVVEAAGSGALATLFPDRVAALAAAAHMPAGIVMGRAIAHEIGHLILGADAHRTSGVMRPVWTGTVIRLGAAREWRFAPDQTVALRERIAARSRARTADGLSLAP